MEKITFPPLIDHLKEQSDFYNQLYRNYQLQYGSIDGKLLSCWVVTVIEPLIKEVAIDFPEKSEAVFKAMYTELLQLLGSKIGITYKNDYTHGWLLCLLVPNLCATTPTRIIRSVNSAIESLRSYQPEKVTLWLELMKTSIRNCKTIEDFLACGRINGWLCGMAHLKERAYNEYIKVSTEIKRDLNAGKTITLEKALAKEWPNLDKAEFVGETGSFVGFGGPFISSPYVALVQNQVLATDGFETFAYFGDSFGKVLLRDIPVPPAKVFEFLTREDFATFKSQFGEQTIPFNDITSCVIKNSTFICTRSSSHHLYIYGLPG